MTSDPADAPRPENSDSPATDPDGANPDSGSSGPPPATGSPAGPAVPTEPPAGDPAGGGAPSSGDPSSGDPGSAKHRIQIGSRLGLDRPRTQKPQVAGADKKLEIETPVSRTSRGVGTKQDESDSGDNPPSTGGDIIRVIVPKPSVRDPLTPELEAEINAALGGAESAEQLMAVDSTSQFGQSLEADTKLRAIVVRVHGDNVFLALGSQNEGVVSVRQFKDPPEVGAALDVIVKKFNAEDGLYEVGVPGASVSVSDWSDLSEGVVVEARVTGSNTGGLECLVNNIRGFIPASQIATHRVEDFSDYTDERLQCVVTEANAQRRNLVLSHRAVLEREQEAKRQELLETLEVGQIHDGIVRNVRDFGAFVDIGGVDGLVHVSQLSWERVNHPSDVVSEGQKVRVRVEKIEPDTGKIGLSIRNLEEAPWGSAATDYPAGTTVTGQVTRLAKFGAFVRLGPGVEGLIHISELAHHRVSNVNSVLSEGQDVQVKILSVDTESQRIALSFKATLDAPAKKTGAKEAEEDEPLRELAVKPQNDGPLKGGTDRPAGGEQFGLQW